MDWKRFSFILFTILVIFGVVVFIGQVRQSPILIITSMLATTIAVATPLTLGALSGLYCERSGVVNIGIEGMMLASAFFGWLGAIYMYHAMGSSVNFAIGMGVFFAVLTGGLMALLHAVLSITFKVDQIIGGTVINILAVGLTGFLNRQMFFGRGSVFGGDIPNSPGVLPTIHVPITEIFSPLCNEAAACLQNITAINRVFDQKPIAISAILLVFISHFVLFNTRWGLRTRAVGEHPKAADTVGINVVKMRYANVIIGGFFAGLAGAYFTIESVPSFEPLLTNGRGFISLAAMIFGNWTPIGAWAASLVFGASQALNINLQIFRDVIPPQLAFLQQSYIVGLTPYILTMFILTGVIGKTTPPAADGVPYEK
ncbi:MAG: ABC transporter permease [Anaerolineales bacterium]|jgi:simple sugar transport system permease protein|nr:ABC transporter permease [Anaerolineales bacterium]WKZ40716.1 MAG: ABC transporter permease [Anaerolineales bacterium]